MNWQITLSFAALLIWGWNTYTSSRLTNHYMLLCSLAGTAACAALVIILAIKQ